MARFAIAVLGYKQSKILNLHASLFQNEDFVFFVHVDRKQDLDAYRESIRPYPNVHFIADRQEIFWGGFNMVLATISLLEAALARRDVESVALISDDTFPLKPSDAIVQRLASGNSFMEFWDIKPRTHDLWRRYDEFYYFDSDIVNPRTRGPEARAITQKDIDAFAAIAQLRQRGKRPLSNYCKGSQWWTLSRPHAERILERIHDDTHLRESFRFSCVPDESYFQTVFKLEFPHEYLAPSLMATDWTKSPLPYIFNDAEEIKSSVRRDAMYFRKVSDDADLLSELHRKLASGQSLFD